MARLFATSINLNKNELQNARIQNLSANPSSPVAGQIYFNTVENELRYYDGSQWISGSSVEFGNTASRPSASKAGQIYVDTEDTVIYVDNGGSWIQGTVSPEDVADAIDYHNNQSHGVHGVTGNVVGTSDIQTLTGKTINDTLNFTNPSTTPVDGEIYVDDNNENFVIKANTEDLVLESSNGDVVVNPDGELKVNGSLTSSGSVNTSLVSGTVYQGANGNLTLQDAYGESQIHINSSTKNIELLPGNGSKAFYGSAATAGNEIAKISDLQALSSGLSWKEAVHLLSDSNIPLSGDLINDLVSIDGHGIGAASPDPVGDGYRILLTGQTNPAENGIYVLSLDMPNASYTLTRSDDANSDADLDGAAVFVMEGTQYGATSWVQREHYISSFAGQIWVQFSGQGTYIGSNSIEIDGNQVNAVVDITRGLAIDGDGIHATISKGLSFDGTNGAIRINAGAGFDLSSGSLELAPGYGVRKYATSIGDNSATSFTINHNLNTKDVTVQIFENASSYSQIEADVEHTSTSAVTIKFASAPTTDEYRVVIIG